jgi:hypothetical protein
MKTLGELSLAQLRQAVQLREEIDRLQEQLTAALGGDGASVSFRAVHPRGKRVLSAAGRARIIAAQRARWARVHAGKPAAAKSTVQHKNRLSAAGRAAIAAAARARWQKFRKQNA